jgi:lipoprotein-anchoring transpeptidase ErfK/SrfK
MRRWARLAICAALLGLAACSGGSGAKATSTTVKGDAARVDAGPLPAPPTPDPVVVATATTSLVDVYDTADGTGTPPRTVSSPRPSGTAAVFLVTQRRGEMVEVLLPVRPSGSKGWLKSSQVSLTQHRWRIVVELTAHRLTVFQGGDVVRVETIGVGSAATRTPGGRWFTTELLKPPSDGTYGTYAYGLSGFTGDPGGPEGVQGQLGLHGTNDPTTLGRDVSLGCIRMSNDAITALATQLPLGVPVDVRT